MWRGRCGRGHALHHNGMLRRTTHASSGQSYARSRILPRLHSSSIISGRNRWALRASSESVLPGLVSIPARRLVKVAVVVRKANSMQYGHRCACICGSMKAYRSESASSIRNKQECLEWPQTLEIYPEFTCVLADHISRCIHSHA